MTLPRTKFGLVVLFALVNAGAASGAACGVTNANTGQWNTGRNGQLTVTFGTAVTSWELEVTFDRPVNQLFVWQGVVTALSDTRFRVKNQSYNGNNSGGSSLSLGWQALFAWTTTLPSLSSAKLVGCDSTGTTALITSTTTSSTTTTTTTTTTTVKTSPTTTSDGSQNTGDCGVETTRGNSWNQGLDGTFTVTFPVDVSSWEIVMFFDKPLTSLSVYNGVATKMSSTRYSVKNASYNGRVSAGGKVSSGWQARYLASDYPVSVASAELVAPSCSAGPVTSSTSTTTSPTTTTAKTSSTTTSASTETTTVTTTAATTSTAGTSTTTTWTECTGNTKYNYSEAIFKSNLFYQAQRSGYLDAFGDYDHAMVPYRGDSALTDGYDVGVNLVGGYYDAGDYVKFNFPMAAATTLLAWGLLDFHVGYEAAGQLLATRNTVKWATDYFVKCHTKPNELYGQVGDGDVDHSYWTRIEQMSIARPAAKIDQNNPGSDLAGETSAALAAASMAFSASDPSYSAELLQHSKELFEFADNYRGKYSDSIANVAKFYNSWSGYEDELAWAAAWLYKATEDTSYLTKAESLYRDKSVNELSWDDKTSGVQILLAQLTGKALYVGRAKSFCDRMVSGQARTPKDLLWIQQWGSLRHAANVAFACLQAAKIPGLDAARVTAYRSLAVGQIHYALGDTGRSFVVGFGVNPPQRPHHSSSSCPADWSVPCTWNDFHQPGPNPNVLHGALVGGPGQDDSYADVRSDYVKNEVACDYNAGFQSSLAGLKELAVKGELPGTTGPTC